MTAMTESHSLNNKLVVHLASLLDAAGIVNVLWGNYLLCIFGVPTIVEDVTFVVPDKSSSAATSIFLSAGFSACSAYTSCRIANTKFRASPAPCSHVHLDEYICIHLFKQSETLWFVDLRSLPTLGQVVSAEEERRCIGKGRAPTLEEDPLGDHELRRSPELADVHVPTVNHLIEAYIRLMARDKHTFCSFWTAMLCYIRLYVEDRGLIVHEDLEPGCLEAYKAEFEE